jgi:hypothetical protein
VRGADDRRRGRPALLGDVIDAVDHYTAVHTQDVVELSTVSEAISLDETRRRDVEYAALLHDVGKIRVPQAIINKPGQLDEAEWALMRRHTIEGESMLRQVGGALAGVGRFVRSSHERYDGRGYPDGLAGEAIPLESRIVCVCDAYNAMTTDRPYRAARPAAGPPRRSRSCAASGPTRPRRQSLQPRTDGVGPCRRDQRGSSDRAAYVSAAGGRCGCRAEVTPSRRDRSRGLDRLRPSRR